MSVLSQHTIDTRWPRGAQVMGRRAPIYNYAPQPSSPYYQTYPSR